MAGTILIPRIAPSSQSKFCVININKGLSLSNLQLPFVQLGTWMLFYVVYSGEWRWHLPLQIPVRVFIPQSYVRKTQPPTAESKEPLPTVYHMHTLIRNVNSNHNGTLTLMYQGHHVYNGRISISSILYPRQSEKRVESDGWFCPKCWWRDGLKLEGTNPVNYVTGTWSLCHR